MKVQFIALLVLGSGLNHAFGESDPPPRSQIQFRLASSENGEVKLEIENESSVSLRCLVAFPEPERLFLGFPDLAVFEFRDASGALLQPEGSTTSWVQSSLLSSIIDQPVFSTRESATSLVASRTMKLTEQSIGSGEVVSRKYATADILKLFRLQLWLKDGREFRVKLPLLVIIGETAYEKNVTSDWILLP